MVLDLEGCFVLFKLLYYYILTMLTFLKNTICAPYSIPIGLINTYSDFKFDFCYETQQKGLGLDAANMPHHSDTTSGKVEFKKPDMDVKVETKAISNLVNEFIDDNIQLSTSNQSIDQTAKVYCDNNIFEKIERCDGDNECINEVTKDSKQWIEERKKRDKLYWKYGKRKIKSYGCCPNVLQKGTIEHVSSNSVTTKKVQEVVNDVKTEVESTLKEQGVKQAQMDAVINTEATQEANMTNSIESQVSQFINQNTNIGQGITYIDSYGVCDPKRTIKNKEPMGILLKQSAKAESLAKNLIDTSIDMYMENTVEQKASSEVIIDRLGNYRIIVWSLLWNFIIIYLLFKIIMKIA